jgi:hypothetical protein
LPGVLKRRSLDGFLGPILGVVEEKSLFIINLKAINQVLIKEGQANLKAIKVACSRESLDRSTIHSG